MNIGIDLDGVLFDSENLFRIYSAIYNLKIDGQDMINIEELKAQNRYAWTEKQFNEFFEGCIEKVYNNSQVMPLAKEVINALKNKHKIHIITSRGWHEKEIDLTKKRLKEENFEFDKIIFSVKDKLKVCQELNIDVMIDDLYETVDNISKNQIKCFYYKDLVEKHFNNKYVTEVRNWGDIFVEFCKLGILNKNDVNY